MDTPTYYADVCIKALEIKEKYNLTDTQTLLYNHICRGDFKLRNDDGQKFYDGKNNGFGWSGNREWVKNQFKSLIKAKLVKFTSLHDCRDPRYTSWYFYCPEYNLDDLIDAGCYANTSKISMIKHYLNLDDGFEKRNKIYNDIELIYDENNSKRPYTFIYKGEANIYSWDHNSKGEKQDLTWLQGQPTWKAPLYHESFQDMVHNIWSFLAHDGYEYQKIPNYINRRRYSI